MAVEIRELLIKTSLTPEKKGAASAQKDEGDCRVCGGDREAVISDCVEQVLQLMRDREER